MPLRLLALLCILACSLSNSLLAQSALWTSHESDTVHWRELNDDAILAARADDKPLFFFVAHYGNSLARAMLAETFQNQTIAEVLNASFIPILVDTNEQPELASLLARIALEHFQAGELPTCLWTDAHLAPLNGGGYFPPTDDWGGQGFLSVSRNVAEQWKTNRTDFLSSAQERLSRSLATTDTTLTSLQSTKGLFPSDILNAEQAPALQSVTLSNYARYAAMLPSEEATETKATLHSMISQIIAGAGFDSVSGGFFVGSNDLNWRLPLFQKSTTDQAYMLLTLSELHGIDPKPEYADLIRLTVRYIDRALIKENGLAIQFLDSFAIGQTPHDIEGTYYLFDSKDVEAIPDDIAKGWGLTAGGNLDEETDILGIYQTYNVPYTTSPKVLTEAFDDERETLSSLRTNKPPPLSDNTGYTATNALIVRALVKASESVKEPNYRATAKTLFAKTLAATFDEAQGSLFNSDQRSRLASSHGYAQLAAAALCLSESDNSADYLDTARSIYKAWTNDSRFQASPSFGLTVGIDEIRTSIYRDSLLQSPVALHLENLDKLSELTPDHTASILASLPSYVARQPETIRSLHLFALQKRASE